jgi:aryl-alcohol dehydrogenase-like predicted oxidoreductase
MQRVRLRGTDISVSRFVFGTASLHHVGGNAAQRLLDLAAEQGFSHFDTAPLYGSGLGEHMLGRFLRRHRQLGVTTKVGLYPRLGAARTRTGMLARKLAGRVLPPLSLPLARWSVARARRSLDQSLRRLGRDRVELLMLHEPDHRAVDTDEWQRWIEDERGRVGRFGLAGEPEKLLPFAREGSPLAGVLQTRDSAEVSGADSLRRAGFGPQLCYGALSAAGGADPSELLAGALSRNPDAAIIVSTRRPERLPLFAQLAA